MCRQRPLWPRPGPTANRAWRRVSDRLADVLAGRFFAASTFPDGRFYATGTAPKAAAVRTGELGVRQRVVGHVEKCGYRRAGSRRTFCSLSRHLTGRASGIALANVGLSILEMLVQAPDSRLRRAVLLGTPCPGSCRARRLTAVPRMPVLRCRECRYCSGSRSCNGCREHLAPPPPRSATAAATGGGAGQTRLHRTARAPGCFHGATESVLRLADRASSGCPQ